MDWQQLISLAIVAGTICLFVLAHRRQKQRADGCGGGCGCPGTADPAPRPTVTYRATKDGRRQIITRFS